MAITFVNKGTYASGTGTVNATAPASITTDDLLLLFVECEFNSSTPTISGWTGIFAGNSSITDAYLYIFYKWCTGTQATVTVPDTGSSTRAIMTAWRGVSTTTTMPLQSASLQSFPITNLSFPSVTTTVENEMIINAIGFYRTDSASTTNFSSWANANLVSITEGHDQEDASGSGGGIGFAYGIKASSGSIGNTTATAASSTSPILYTMALAPKLDSLTTSPAMTSDSLFNIPTITSVNNKSLTSVIMESNSMFIVPIVTTTSPNVTITSVPFTATSVLNVAVIVTTKTVSINSVVIESISAFNIPSITATKSILVTSIPIESISIFNNPLISTGHTIQSVAIEITSNMNVPIISIIIPIIDVVEINGEILTDISLNSELNGSFEIYSEIEIEIDLIGDFTITSINNGEIILVNSISAEL